MKTSVFTTILILSLLLAAPASSEEFVWTGTLVIDWGGFRRDPQVSLIQGDEATEDVLSKAVPLTGQRFVWEDNEIPGVWVFFLPEEMRGSYFTVSLLKPGKLAGAGSNLFRTNKSVMVSRMVKVEKGKGVRVTRLDANGVVGRLYVVDPTDMRCFGLSEECKLLWKKVGAAQGKK